LPQPRSLREYAEEIDFTAIPYPKAEERAERACCALPCAIQLDNRDVPLHVCRGRLAVGEFGLSGELDGLITGAVSRGGTLHRRILLELISRGRHCLSWR